MTSGFPIQSPAGLGSSPRYSAPTQLQPSAQAALTAQPSLGSFQPSLPPGSEMSQPPPGAHPLQPMYQPQAYVPPPPRPSFAYSSSAKRRRSPSPVPSSSGSEDGDANSVELDDPLDLDRMVANEGGDITEGRGTSNDELEETNRGMRMLLKMGWSAGQGLGKDGQGECRPLRLLTLAR